MRIFSFTCLLLSALLTACQAHPTSKAAANNTTSSNQSHIKSTASTASSNDAVRGQAIPILKRSYFPNTTFVLKSDSITGIETTTLKNGDKLIVTNCGWEYYTLNFRFETTRFQKDTTDLVSWANFAFAQMQEIEPGLAAPLDIKQGIKSFRNFLEKDSVNHYAHLALSEQIDYGGDEIREFVFLNRVENMNDKRFAVEISFSMGPL